MMELFLIAGVIQIFVALVMLGKAGAKEQAQQAQRQQQQSKTKHRKK